MSYFSELSALLAGVDEAYLTVIKRNLRNRTIYTCGNGGSAATAEHFTCDLVKACGINSICLNSNQSLLTAIANDCGYENVFLNQMVNVQSPSVLFILSCSGKSANVVAVAEKIYGTRVVIALTGPAPNPLTKFSNIAISIPSTSYPLIEDCHSAICHRLIKELSDTVS